MKRRKTLICMGMSALLLSMAPMPAEAADTDPAELISEWKADGHLTTYGMVPIHGCDVNEGTWEIEGGKLHSKGDYTDCFLAVDDDVMTLCFTADPEALAEEFPCWTDGLSLLELGDDGEAAAVTTEQTENTVILRVPLGALDQDYTLTDGSNESPLWVDAASLPSGAVKIDLPDYKVLREAMSTLQAEVEENQLVMEPFEPMTLDLPDGEYAIEAEIFGGSGKAAVDTPTYLYVRDGKAYARLRWSSSNYDYMIVGGQRYENEAEPEKNSVFVIPIRYMDEEMTIVADTLAMGTPHEITYGLTFSSASIGDVSQMPQEAAKRVVVIAFIIIIGGGILNHFVKKKRGINTKKKKKH